MSDLRYDELEADRDHLQCQLNKEKAVSANYLKQRDELMESFKRVVARKEELENFKEAVTEYIGSSRVASALDEWRDRNKVPF